MDEKITNPNLFSQPSSGESTISEAWRPPAPTYQAPPDPRRSAWISAQVRQIVSSFRRDDFADADGFSIQLGMILERYPDSIIAEICSPKTGIQRRAKFPPSLAEIVEACDEAAARAERIRRLRELRAAPREPRELGRNRANVFVPADNARYAAMVAKTAGADPLDWRWDDKRAGVWVTLRWLEDTAASTKIKGWSRPTGAELDKLYPQGGTNGLATDR